MPDPARAEPPTLAAGDFSRWLLGFREALGGEHGSDVPCAGCTACCRSSQFVLVEPDEGDTLAAIPSDLLFAAPGRPDGHRLLGYDEQGRCPMLDDDGCSIYDHRPRACRTYDCRIFPAAGVVPRHPDQALIADRVSRWRFSYADVATRGLHDSVKITAQALEDESTSAMSATEVALRAIAIHARSMPR